MPDLRAQLQFCFHGRVCLMGLGNPAYGDDGLGVRLAEQVAAAGVRDVIVAGASPERFVGRVAEAGFAHLIFLDAVEFGGMPGSVVWLEAAEMRARFPQVSTHKMGLGLLAGWLEANSPTRAWLLGVQPQSLRPAPQLTPVVRTSLEILAGLLTELAAGTPARSGWRTPDLAPA